MPKVSLTITADDAGTILAAAAITDASQMLADAAELVAGFIADGHSQRAIAAAVNTHKAGRASLSPTTVGRLGALHAVRLAHGVRGLSDVWTLSANVPSPVAAIVAASESASMADALGSFAPDAPAESVAPDASQDAPATGGPSQGSGVAGSLSDAPADSAPDASQTDPGPSQTRARANVSADAESRAIAVRLAGITSDGLALRLVIAETVARARAEWWRARIASDVRDAKAARVLATQAAKAARLADAKAARIARAQAALAKAQAA